MCWFLLGVLILGLTAGYARTAGAGAVRTKIVLFGDSTVITGYLPEGDRIHTMLQARLREVYGVEGIDVKNVARGGEFIARLFLSGKYERVRRELEGIDIAIIRYGQNDGKRFTPEEFRRHFGALCDVLKEDFPGVQFVLETGLFFDPAHMARDRNPSLIPYWEQTRHLAQDRGLPVCDVYRAMEAETARGNWDLRVRGGGDVEIVADDREDASHEGDLRWFSNGHPNAAGNRVAVEEQVRVLQRVFPDSLPAGGRKADRAPRTVEALADRIGVSPDDVD